MALTRTRSSITWLRAAREDRLSKVGIAVYLPGRGSSSRASKRRPPIQRI